MNKRLRWLDYIKAICMVAVIMSHLYWPEEYARYLSPFYLSGFFFASGYTFSIKNSFREFFVQKIRTLAWPVLVLGFMNALVSYWYADIPLGTRVLYLMIQIPGLWDDLWFVACLFTMELIFYPIVRYVKATWVRMLILTGVYMAGLTYAMSGKMHLPWQLENACIMLPFLYWGFMTRQSDIVSKFMSKLQRKDILLFLAIIYMLFVNIFDNYPIDIHVLEFGNMFYYMVNAVVGTMLIISLAMVLDQFGDLIILQYIGKNTLVYYAFQSKIITAIIYLCRMCGCSVNSYMGNIIFALLTCIILILPTEIINRYFPFLLGRKQK